MSSLSKVFIAIAFLLISTYGAREQKTFDYFNEETTGYKIWTDTDVLLTKSLALVTGSTSGIGKETVRILAYADCRVIMAARDEKENQRTRIDIIHEIGENQLLPKHQIKRLYKRLIPMKLDLSSLQSILDFAKEVYIRFPEPINFVFANAGVMAIPQFTLTKDGFEQQFGVNYLGHYYLSRLLTNKLTQYSGSKRDSGRLITVSSRAHGYAPKPFSEVIENNIPPTEDQYEAWRNYGISKAGNILFARELQRREGYKGLISVSLHPGVIKTGLQRFLTEEYIAAKTFDKNIEQGAATQIYCAFIPEDQLTAGGYYDDCQLHEDRVRDDLKTREGFFEKGFDATNTNEYKLWELSEKLIEDAGFTFEFMIEHTPPPGVEIEKEDLR